MEIQIFRKGTKVSPKLVSTEQPFTYKLSQEQHKYYEENGFLVIKRLIDFTDLYNYKQHFLKICKGTVTPGNLTIVKERTLMGKVEKMEDYINKLQDIQHDEVFMTYTEHPRLVDAVAQLIGEPLLVTNCMFINKPPGASVHPAHQDLHYFPFRPAEKILGTWTAVDDATEENGCLWVVPGSHRANKLYAHDSLPGALKMYHGIADGSVAPSSKRAHLEMAPGDTVLFHPMLVHGSEANTSKYHRKSISAHYANASVEYIDVNGTVQDNIAREVEREASRRGLEDMDFATIWKMKSKEVRRKSKL